MAADPSDRRADLSAAKRALLDEKLARRRTPAQTENARSSTIPRGSADERVPLSASQRPLWFLARAHPAHATYHLHDTVRLRGPLDTEALTRSLCEIVRRHGALRTRFLPQRSIGGDTSGDDSGCGDCEQVVADPEPMRITEEDLRHIPEPARPRAAIERAVQFTTEQFDLERGPLFRVAAIRVGEQEWWLVLALHHLIADEASLAILWRELSTLYPRASGEIAAHLRDVPLPKGPEFADVIRWQERRRASNGAKDREYWTAQLAGFERLRLPGDQIDEPGGARPGRLIDADLSPRISADLEDLCHREDVTPFVLGMAAFQVFLHRLAAKDRFAVGTPITLRHEPELADVVGYMINTVAVVADFSDGPSLRDLLENDRGQVIRSFEHAAFPLQELSGVTIDNLFVVLQEGRRSLGVEGIDIEREILDTSTAKFDVTLFLTPTPRRWNLRLEYRTDRFAAATAELWLAQIATILEATLEGDALATSRQADALFRPSPVERRELLESTGRGAELSTGESDPDATVLALIESSIERDPDATAVSCGEESLSYRELSAHADRVAAALVVDGVHRGSRVGVCLERSVSLIAAILGTLRTGACYVPLAPDNPRARLRNLAADAGVTHVLTTTALVERLHEVAAPTICVEHLTDTKAHATQGPGPGPEDLAYVLYTSGSTGEPKGVAVEHRQLLATTAARRQYYPDRVRGFLLLSSFAFDSSVAGIYWTLADGGTIHVPTEGQILDVGALGTIVAERGVSHLLAIPALYREMITTLAARPSSLHVVIVAGEPCPSDLPGQHGKCLPDVALFNEYGPTEATVWSTVHHIDVDHASSSVPIGRPVPGARLYVVDEHDELCPVGVSGELLIGGSGVARGYWNRPELTQERFIRDPFRPSTGSRVYRTGDLARFDANGDLHFVGRTDRQVKHRGHRIELREIESTLSAHPSIQESVVELCATHDTRDDPARLEAWLRSLDPQSCESLLSEIEDTCVPGGPLVPNSADKVEARARFAVRLERLDSGFIAPPRREQRDWLLRQALAEVADDLEHLDEIAGRFVPGMESRFHDAYPDVSRRALTEQEIMEDWQVPVMREMARHAAGSHGDVLEIGFGRGVSAEFLQEEGVRSHVIVEANEHSVTDHFEPWRRRHPDRDIRLCAGRWQDVYDELDLFDGILFHAFPLDEKEFVEQVVESITFAAHAFEKMAARLRPGGVFTYLSTEIDSLSRRHQRALFAHFREVSTSLLPVHVPENTRDAWWADTMVIVKAVR